MPLDLWSAEHWEAKAWKRVHEAKPHEFEPWEEARERYIETKVEPMLQQYRERDHDWFSDWNRRRGVMLHSSDLIYRLQKLNPHIVVQQQVNFPDDWGLYTSALGRVQFLTGVPKGWLTEFSYSLVDGRNLPIEERRGWRTVIIYCLMKGAVTWGQLLAEFGEPQDGFNDQRWQETVLDIRHGGEQIFQRNIGNVLS